MSKISILHKIQACNLEIFVQHCFFEKHFVSLPCAVSFIFVIETFIAFCH